MTSSTAHRQLETRRRLRARLAGWRGPLAWEDGSCRALAGRLHRGTHVFFPRAPPPCVPQLHAGCRGAEVVLLQCMLAPVLAGAGEWQPAPGVWGARARAAGGACGGCSQPHVDARETLPPPRQRAACRGLSGSRKVWTRALQPAAGTAAAALPAGQPRLVAPTRCWLPAAAQPLSPRLLRAASAEEAPSQRRAHCRYLGRGARPTAARAAPAWGQAARAPTQRHSSWRQRASPFTSGGGPRAQTPAASGCRLRASASR